MTTIDNQRIVADLYLLPTNAGGRRTGVGQGYRPRLYLADVSTDCSFDLAGDDEIFPGDKTEVKLRLLFPEGAKKFEDKLSVGAQFELREGGRVVATGTVRHIGPLERA